MALTNHKKVIILISLPEVWSFWDFVYLSGGTPIQDWYESLSDHGRQLFDNMLKVNQKTENHLNWMGWRKYLKGGKLKGEGIWELGFSSDDRAYRILGIFDGQKRAIFLVGCYHKGGNYTPTDALQTALDRKNLHLRKGCQLHERKIKADR